MLLKRWLVLAALLFALPAAAQRLAPDPFWLLAPATHTVYFGGHSHLTGETPTESAQHIRRWLTAYFTSWEEFNSGDVNKLNFSARLRGLHEGVELRCALATKLETDGFRYILTQFLVGAPTGDGRQQWHDLHRVLEDADFRPDIDQFQEAVGEALPNL